MAVVVAEVCLWVAQGDATLVKEIVAEVHDELLPNVAGASQLAIHQECGKDTTDSLRHPVHDGLLQAADPFFAGLEQSPRDARVAESGMNDVVISLEVVEAGTPAL